MDSDYENANSEATALICVGFEIQGQNSRCIITTLVDCILLVDYPFIQSVKVCRE